MARTVDYFYQQILTQKAAEPLLNSLDATGKTADFNLWAFIVAVVMATLDNLFDLHKAMIDALIATKVAHKLKWYRDLALRFQYGQDTIEDSDQYANEGLTAPQIAAQKIIAQAAVTEVATPVFIGLRIKVVTLAGTVYTPLSAPQKAAFSTFIADQKDAGVNIVIDSLPPDNLKLIMDIWYNPLVLRNDGSRIDGTSASPVPDAINGYLKNLKFNGEFSNTLLVDALQAVDGVERPVIKLSQAKYGLFAFTPIDENYIPDAGYMVLNPADLTINYRAYV